MILTKLGVPYSEAMIWSQSRRWAALVVMGEHDGGEFDWDALRWIEKKP